MWGAQVKFQIGHPFLTEVFVVHPHSCWTDAHKSQIVLLFTMYRMRHWQQCKISYTWNWLNLYIYIYIHTCGHTCTPMHAHAHTRTRMHMTRIWIRERDKNEHWVSIVMRTEFESGWNGDDFDLCIKCVWFRSWLSH